MNQRNTKNCCEIWKRNARRASARPRPTRARESKRLNLLRSSSTVSEFFAAKQCNFYETQVLLPHRLERRRRLRELHPRGGHARRQRRDYNPLGLNASVPPFAGLHLSIDARFAASSRMNAVSFSRAHAQRTVFRCDARQRSRLFAPSNQWLKRSPKSLRLAKPVADNAFLHLPRNLQPDFTHYLCEQRTTTERKKRNMYEYTDPSQTNRSAIPPHCACLLWAFASNTSSYSAAEWVLSEFDDSGRMRCS